MYTIPQGEGSGTCLPPAGLSNEHGCLHSQGRVGREEKNKNKKGGMERKGK